MEQAERNSAYRDFRISAYRKKYDIALVYGGKYVSFGALLSRVEYAYNTFCQMGLTPGSRVCLCLPNCPDLLASFYGLSRLGAIGVLIHPEDTPREMRRQMEAAESKLLITTEGRYEAYCKEYAPLPPGQVVLCRPERDMKRRERRVYRAMEKKAADAEGFFLEEMMAENRYNALDTPFGDGAQDAVAIGGTSSFLAPEFITYLPEELAVVSQAFWHRKENVRTVYIENSFASEGGFLAAHGALSCGKTVLWSIGEPYEFLKKEMPDFLVATEEFFWEFRQKTAFFCEDWKSLQGGYQVGKPLTPLMEKFAGRAFSKVGGRGALATAPVMLKMQKAGLFPVKDYGVRLADMERVILGLSGIEKCRCLADDAGIRLQILPDRKKPATAWGRRLAAYCRKEMNPAHLPRKVEFCSSL